LIYYLASYILNVSLSDNTYTYDSDEYKYITGIFLETLSGFPALKQIFWLTRS